jgi:dTDP-4-amino-4,6-dideoxygalactose transaminase
VVTTPLTFAATLNAIIEAGATARFVDVELEDFGLDVAQLGSAIRDRTRAVMPVHLYGLPCRMDEIETVARERGLRVVEDAAQALGATVRGRPVGSYDVGCFSLYATKNVTAGEGGMITTDDAELAGRVRELRNQGMRARYEYVRPGHNFRLTELQAAVAIPQLGRIEAINDARRRNARALTEGLDGIRGLVPPAVPADRTHVFHQYTVRVTEDARLTRDELATELGRAGIGTGVYYPKLVFDFDCYRSHPQVVVSPLPRAECAAREVLSLPVHPHVASADVERIAKTVRSLLS